MRRIALLVAAAGLLVTVHQFYLAHATDIAAWFAPERWPGMSDARHFQFHLAPVRGVQSLIVNVTFSAVYFLLVCLAVVEFVRWLDAVGIPLAQRAGRAASQGSRAVAQAAGVKDMLSSHQLSRVEKELLRVKTLFDNGLITEAEFNAKKRDLRARIEGENLMK